MNMKLKNVLIAFALLVSALNLVSCKDNVDESNMYTFVGKLMADYVDEDESLSKFSYLTKRVKLSDNSESTVHDLLSARGNFTCFAPTNEAVQQYLDSLYNTPGYDITQTPDSTAQFIVNNCLIDHKDSEALFSTSFLEGTIETQSFAGRFVTINFDTITGGTYIDKFSRVISRDIEVENGIVHKVNKVVAPTVSSLAALIEATPYLQVFANLLKLTGYDEQLASAYRDMEYEKNHPVEGLGTPTETGDKPVPCPEHRDFGFTAFVEVDSLYEKKFGFKVQKENGQISNWDEVFAVIKDKCREFYPDAKSNDLKSDENAVHQFVGYHLIDRSVPYNLLNVHYNEQGYGYKYPENLSIDTWCYYPTLSQHRIMKIMEGKQINGKRINRYVSKRDYSNFSEVEVPRQGILLRNYGDNAALNGYFYTIDDILVYDKDVPNKVLNERMRYDLCDLLPEQMSSGYRRITTGNATKGLNIPTGYFENMTFTEDSRVVYLGAWGAQWQNYQGDEYNIVGQYDVTIKLPHVPYYGTYELRLGLQNLNTRGMCQVYFGTNKNNLEATGLPLDMRVCTNHDITGFAEDDRNGDVDIDTETKKRMRLKGYLKAPKYFGPASSAAVTSHYRNNERVLRGIIYTGNFDPKETYYIRLKSVLENTTTQLFLDYIELCPKSIYAGQYEEDEW